MTLYYCDRCGRGFAFSKSNKIIMYENNETTNKRVVDLCSVCANEYIQELNAFMNPTKIKFEKDDKSTSDAETTPKA